jgi:aryl-alcohol dehydrogenase-like predicted oxidoreductase
LKKRALGRTGLQVSEIAFGGVEIGIPYGIGVQSHADMPSDADAINLLHAARNGGINFFDTARSYGRSEEIIGTAFAGTRADVVICSKCAHLPKTDGRLASDKEIKTMIRASLQASLEALQTDYVDVYMLHSATTEILQHQAVVECFQELKQQNLIRATGASTYSVSESDLAIKSGAWDVLQISFNLLDQRQAAIFDQAEQAGVGLVIRSVLLKGVLSDKGRNLHPALAAISEHRNRYQAILDETGWTLSSLATKFALSFPQVATVLVGFDRMTYLEQALAAADGRYLDAAGLARAQQLKYPDAEFIDLPYWDRMGWLK